MYLETLNLTDANLLSSSTIGNNFVNVTLTNGSANVAGLTGMSNSNIGQYISPITGFNIGSFITSVTNTSLVTLSSTYTGSTTSSATVAFYPIIGSSIDTTNYASVVLQLTGNFFAEIYIEGSNDNTNWDKLYVLPLNDFVLTDNISVAGNYHLKTSTRYIRYNVQQITNGTVANIVIYGRSGTGPSAADGLSLALSQEQVVPLNVNVTQGLKKDQTNALVLSDAPSLVQVVAAVGQVTVIDTQGYQTIQITTGAYNGSITGSNDGVTYTTLIGYNSSTLAPISTVSASSSYIIPAGMRYIKLTCSIAGMLTYFLRYGAGLIGGTTSVTGGVAGSLAVGAASAANAAPTYNYLGVASADTSGLARRIVSDTTGRLQIAGFNAIAAQVANTIATNPATAIGAITSTNQATAALNVQDTAQFEGQSIVELLALILLELRILNQQHYETAYQLNTGTVSLDPPENYRNDPQPNMFLT